MINLLDLAVLPDPVDTTNDTFAIIAVVVLVVLIVGLSIVMLKKNK